jgi:ketosteroid isomerase-like protein
MDHASAQDWLDRYVRAWTSYDPAEIGPLFTDDVVYRYHPSDDPTLGRAAVVASWLGEGDAHGASTRDAPGTYRARYAPIAVDGDTVVAVGTTHYTEVPGGPVVRTYDNCFVMRFDGDGQCREFTEYYVRRPD